MYCYGAWPSNQFRHSENGLKKVSVLGRSAGETMNADALILQRFRGLYNTGLSRVIRKGWGDVSISLPG
jgi:hypothetical protein